MKKIYSFKSTMIIITSVFLISSLFIACEKSETIDVNNSSNENVTYLIKMKGGGGYYSETIIEFDCSDTPLMVKGKGYSDDDDHEVRVGISNSPENFMDFSGNSWNTINGVSSTFYVLLNSKWGTDNDTYAQLKVELPNNGTIHYSKYDNHSDNLSYVTITKE